MIGSRLMVELRSGISHHESASYRVQNLLRQSLYQRTFMLLDDVKAGVNMSLPSNHNTTAWLDLILHKEQHSETPALPITNTAAAPDAWFLRLPLEIREQIYSHLIDHYPKYHGSGMNPSPAGKIIFRRNRFHSAILSTNWQIKEEALHVFCRETAWHIQIPAVSTQPQPSYHGFHYWKLLHKHPFFKLMRHIKLVFMMPNMGPNICIKPNGTIDIYGRVRRFGYLTDVRPRQFVVEQIVKALAHAPALKTVSIEWNDIVGWGDWEDRYLCLLPLEKLPARCVVESVDLALPPAMDYGLYQSWFWKQTREPSQNPNIDLHRLNEHGRKKLVDFLTEIASK